MCTDYIKNVDDQVILERNIELEDKDGDFVGSISDDIKDIKSGIIIRHIFTRLTSNY